MWSVFIVLGLLISPSSAADAEAALRTSFEERLAACPRDDLDCRLAVGAWATAEGLAAEAEEVYRGILARVPQHDQAYERLLEITRGRKLPRDSESLATARKLLPRGFREYETKRFVVLSNASPRWTRAKLGLLERTHDQFSRYAHRLSLRPWPLRHKLVGVFFDQRDEYAAFGHAHDRMRMTWSQGYYALAADRLVLYNAEADGPADEFASARAVATLIHETVHQLHYHTRLQNPHVQYPIWISEGLATAFETDAPDAAFGPQHDFEPRRTRFTGLMKRGELIPLRVLVQLDRMPDDRRETAFTVYNQSYGLVAWLARHRARPLRTYLGLMLEEPAGRPRPQRHLELFERAFGDVDQIEERWLLDERGSSR